MLEAEIGCAGGVSLRALEEDEVGLSSDGSLRFQLLISRSSKTVSCSERLNANPTNVAYTWNRLLLLN